MTMQRKQLYIKAQLKCMSDWVYKWITEWMVSGNDRQWLSQKTRTILAV